MYNVITFEVKLKKTINPWDFKVLYIIHKDKKSNVSEDIKNVYSDFV